MTRPPFLRAALNPALRIGVASCALTFLAILPTVILLDGRAPSPWHWAVFIVSATVLSVAVWPITRLKIASRKIGVRQLRRRWPVLIAKVHSSSEFFDHSIVYSLYQPLFATSSIADPSMTSEAIATLNGRREGAFNGLGLMQSVVWQLLDDVQQMPRNTEEAQKIVKRFETLIAAPQVLGISSLLKDFSNRSSRRELSECEQRLSQFRRDYESVARTVNQELGVNFLREHVP